MRVLLTITLLLLLVSNQLLAQQKDLLSGKYSGDQLKNVLIPQAKWIPFPKPADETGWAKADQTMLTSIG